MTANQELSAVEAMRAFNRFYTEKLGVLGRGYLDSGYTLTEARIVYEIGSGRSLTATELTRALHVDAAHISRILKKFRTAGLLETTPDPADQRNQIISATPAGIAEFERLADRSRSQIASMLAPLGPQDRAHLAAAFATIRRLLDPGSCPDAPTIIRPHRPGDIGWIVQSQAEFYTREFGWNDQFEALVADVAGKFLANFKPEREYCWIAERGGQRIGSVLVADAGNGVAKLRLLYIDASARGLGLGRTLVNECIRFSKATGYRQLTLWTNDILHAARHIYVKAGFHLVSEERHSLFGREENGQTWTLDL